MAPEIYNVNLPEREDDLNPQRVVVAADDEARKKISRVFGELFVEGEELTDSVVTEKTVTIGGSGRVVVEETTDPADITKS